MLNRNADPPLPPLAKGKKKAIIERIAEGPPLLLDGALGSRLMQMGLPAGLPPEVWILDNSEAVEAVHREYVQAGSEALTAVTFGANRARLLKCGLEAHLEIINRKAVEIARKVAGERVYVAADLGPTGEFLQPLGQLTPERASEIYREQVCILAQAGVDFFLLETFYDLREACLCLAACRLVAPQIPAAASLTFKKTKRGFFTEMGNPALESLKALHDEGAFLVGANCTLEAQGMLELAGSLLDPPQPPLNKGGIKGIPMIFQPNAGSPQVTTEGIFYPQNAEEFADRIAEIAALGARAIGGCCGTEGGYILEMKKRIQETGHRIQEK